MWDSTMLPEKDTLPSTKQQLAVPHWHRHRRSGENGTRVSSHIVVAFRVVPVSRVTVRRPASSQRFQVHPHGWVGILGNQQGTAGVLNENMSNAGLNAGIANELRHIRRHINRLTARGTNIESGLLGSHVRDGAKDFGSRMMPLATIRGRTHAWAAWQRSCDPRPS
jgi:hypothetical protein